MASQFVEQIMAQHIAANDPETKAVTELISAQAATLQEDLKVKRANTVNSISELYLKALATPDLPPAVKNAYEKLLNTVSD